MESFRFGLVDKHHWPDIYTSINNMKIRNNEAQMHFDSKLI